MHVELIKRHMHEDRSQEGCRFLSISQHYKSVFSLEKPIPLSYLTLISKLLRISACCVTSTSVPSHTHALILVSKYISQITGQYIFDVFISVSMHIFVLLIHILIFHAQIYMHNYVLEIFLQWTNRARPCDCDRLLPGQLALIENVILCHWILL